jgi:hypothetical protein
VVTVLRTEERLLLPATAIETLQEIYKLTNTHKIKQHTLIARLPSLKAGCIDFETLLKKKKILECCSVIWRTERASGTRRHQAGGGKGTASMTNVNNLDKIR